jgi:small redox-active disulfide protein 2
MKIKVLGPGCKNCETLEKNLLNVLAELNAAADVQKVTRMDEIMQYDVMMTPALVINDKVKVAGRVPKTEELKKLIQEEL